MLFSEPKIPQSGGVLRSGDAADVSVLFSEPKIPQSFRRPRQHCASARFSALQRAENSSIAERYGQNQHEDLFQCSSASRKFLNDSDLQRLDRGVECFSALQRAENSSIRRARVVTHPPSGFSALQRAENSSICLFRSDREEADQFQCSSASRKFLNIGSSAA